MVTWIYPNTAITFIYTYIMDVIHACDLTALVAKLLRLINAKHHWCKIDVYIITASATSETNCITQITTVWLLCEVHSRPLYTTQHGHFFGCALHMAVWNIVLFIVIIICISMAITWLMCVLLMMCGYHGAGRYMYCSMIKLAIGYAMH